MVWNFTAVRQEKPKMNSKVTVQARKKGGKGEVHRMEINRANNGFSTRTHYKQPEGKMNEPSPYVQPEENVHEDAEGMLDHVGNMFGAKPKGKAAPAKGGKAGEPDGDED